MTAEKSTDHIDRGLAKAISIFKDKPVFQALLSSFLAEIQELENAIFEVIVYSGIDEVEGVSLDVLGKVLLRGRNGLSDVDYRIALKAQIAINRSQGTPVDVLKVATLSLPAGFTITYVELYPAAIFVMINEAPVSFTPRVLFESLKTAKPAGVRLLFQYSIAPSGEAFMFSHTSDVASMTQGFGHGLTPTTGGYLDHMLVA